ncbi:MAG TPA: hypothetical protein VFX12_03230 [Vicinamibacterales bacterium]|nr:hypothetical protein [Vicinamibacterales bacterium]
MRMRPLGWIVTAYCALAVLETWPVARHVADRLPHDPGDPVLNAWILWWNAHALPLTTAWWNAPAFFPIQGSLALSESLLGLSPLTTPIQWLGGSPILAYNLVFLGSFALAGTFTFLLCLELTHRGDLAFLAGVLFAFNPYLLSHISHLQMVASFWMPLALWAAHRFVRAGGLRWALIFAVAWLLQAVTNGYMLVFFSVVAGLWILWFATGRHTARAAVLVAGLAIGVLALVPLLMGYATVLHGQGLVRPAWEVRMFSADALGLFSPSSIAVLYPQGHLSPASEGDLFPGVVLLAISAVSGGWALQRLVRAPWSWLAIALAVLSGVFAGAALSVPITGGWGFYGWGFALSVRRAYKPLTLAAMAAVAALCVQPGFGAGVRRRSPLLFYAIAATLMYTLAWGPRPLFGGMRFLYYGPYDLLAWIPGVDALRVPARAWLPGTLALTTACVLALERLLPRARRRQILGALTALAVIEGCVAPLPLANVPSPVPAAMTKNANVVVELPLGGVDEDAAAMYRGTRHRLPVVNGYSGYAPRAYDVLSHALHDGDFDVLRAIPYKGQLLVIAKPEFAGRAALERWVHGQRGARAFRGTPTFPYAFTLPAETEAVDRGAPQSSGVVAVMATASAQDVHLVADHDPSTRWTTGRPQRAGDAIVVDAGLDRVLTGVVLEMGPAVLDYPRGLDISVSDDAVAWTSVWRGRTAPLAYRAALEHPLNPSLRVGFPPTPGRYLRLRLLHDDPTYWWSIGELRIMGSG